MANPRWSLIISPPLADHTLDERTDAKAADINADAVAAPIGQDSLTAFIRRAVRLADEVSAAIIDLRMRQAPPRQRPFETSPLRECWDKVILSEHLLDPGRPDVDLIEMRYYLMELARNQLPWFPREGLA